MAKQGFTLAEVLITLGMIGVVAALTIPNVMKGSERKVLENQFKVAYSLLQNAIMTIGFENPNLYDEIHGYGSNNGAYIVLKPALENQFKQSGQFGRNSLYANLAVNYRNYDNTTTAPNFWGDYGQFALINGMIVFTECSLGCKYIHVFIDTNGAKGPNRNGHDLFDFELNNRMQLVPSGQFGTECHHADNAMFSGFDCTQQALSERNYFKNLPN